jgi:MFS transporter, DHA1 family, multidrug resistance protein
MADPARRAPSVTGELPDDPEASPTAIPWRRNLTAIWAVQVLAIVGFSLRVPFLPFFIGELGVPDTSGQALWSGVINAAGAGTMAITAPLWGIVADRHGRRMMLIRATFAGAFTVGLMAFATAPWQLAALRMVEGTLTGTVTAATVLVVTTTPKARLGFALGLLQTAIFAGASFGPLVGGLLADRIGPRPTFLVAGAMLAAAGVLSVLVVREAFTPTPRTVVDDDVRQGRWARFRASAVPLFGGAVVMLILALFVIRFAAMAVQPILPLFVQELVPGTTEAASISGIVLGALGLTSALSAVVLGRMGDRRGHKRLLVVCVAAAGLLYLPMALARTPWQLAALQGAFGIAAGGMIPAANALIANLTPSNRRATMYGITASAASLGAFIGPLMGATLAVAIGFRATFVAVGLLLAALAIALAARIPAASSENA